MMIYKILPAHDYQQWQRDGLYHGSSVDTRDGYIHLSSAEQVLGTLQRHFAGQRTLLLVGLDPRALQDSLRIEASSSGALFPHAYGSIAWSAVRSVETLRD
jgi:uncharacterized protein (DUF952 family)